MPATMLSPCVSMLYAILFQYPMETYGYAVIFSVTGYFGVNIVLSLVKNFGALMAVTGLVFSYIVDFEVMCYFLVPLH